MNKDEIFRGLLCNSRGSNEWRRYYSAYRRTDHWRARSAAKLASDPFCQVCELMGNRNIRAVEVHHAEYNFFSEAIIGEMVSICKKCHLGYEQRRMRRYKR